MLLCAVGQISRGAVGSKRRIQITVQPFLLADLVHFEPWRLSCPSVSSTRNGKAKLCYHLLDVVMTKHCVANPLETLPALVCPTARHSCVGDYLQYLHLFPQVLIWIQFEHKWLRRVLILVKRANKGKSSQWEYFPKEEVTISVFLTCHFDSTHHIFIRAYPEPKLADWVFFFSFIKLLISGQSERKRMPINFVNHFSFANATLPLILLLT